MRYEVKKGEHMSEAIEKIINYYNLDFDKDVVEYTTDIPHKMTGYNIGGLDDSTDDKINMLIDILDTLEYYGYIASVADDVEMYGYNITLIKGGKKSISQFNIALW